MQTSNSLALYAWFTATLAGSHSFHLVRALSRSPSLDGAYIIYLRSKKVNYFEYFFSSCFSRFPCISRSIDSVLNYFCGFHWNTSFFLHRTSTKKGETTRKAGSPSIYSLVISLYSPETQPIWLLIITARQPFATVAMPSSKCQLFRIEAIILFLTYARIGIRIVL